MSAAVDQFCDSLREGLSIAETRLQAAKKNVCAIAGQAEKTVREKCDETHRKAQAQKQRVDQLHASLRIAAQKNIAETKQLVSDWKAQSEAPQLNARADRAEAYALNAIEYATAAIDEADEAILDAVVARLDANSVQ